jgi:hypothetical protein
MQCEDGILVDLMDDGAKVRPLVCRMGHPITRAYLSRYQPTDRPTDLSNMGQPINNPLNLTNCEAKGRQRS